MAIVVTRPVGMLGCNMSIIADPNSLEAVLVDPGGDPDDIIHIISTRGFKVVQIVITHAHFDHILACNELESFTKAPIYYNPGDRQLWLSLGLQCMFVGIPNASRIKPPTNTLAHGDDLKVRNGKVLHTPGHTQGSLCFYFEQDKLICTGDTLFAGSIGRTDLPGGNPAQILQSLKEIVMVLPEDTRVIPGHGEETTIGKEKIQNPYVNGDFR